MSQVNNFEQVRGLGVGVPPKSTSLNRSKCDHMGTTLLVDRHTNENITFPQLCWRAVQNGETVTRIITSK